MPNYIDERLIEIALKRAKEGHKEPINIHYKRKDAIATIEQEIGLTVRLYFKGAPGAA